MNGFRATAAGPARYHRCLKAMEVATLGWLATLSWQSRCRIILGDMHRSIFLCGGSQWLGAFKAVPREQAQARGGFLGPLEMPMVLVPIAFHQSLKEFHKHMGNAPMEVGAAATALVI